MLASWLPFALFALVVWSVQRVVTKVALVRWSTARFYRLNAILSLGVYAVFRGRRAAGSPRRGRRYYFVSAHGNEVLGDD
jgi:hypothetical protein